MWIIQRRRSADIEAQQTQIHADMFCDLPSPGEAPRKRVRREGEEQGKRHDGCPLSVGVRNKANFATTWGRTGFDGDVEAGIAGGCAQHPKNGQLIN